MMKAACNILLHTEIGISSMEEFGREWKKQPEENLEGSHYLSSEKIHGWETTSFQLSPHLWSFSCIIVPCVDSAVISFFFYFPPVTYVING